MEEFSAPLENVRQKRQRAFQSCVHRRTAVETGQLEDNSEAKIDTDAKDHVLKKTQMIDRIYSRGEEP